MASSGRTGRKKGPPRPECLVTQSTSCTWGMGTERDKMTPRRQEKKLFSDLRCSRSVTVLDKGFNRNDDVMEFCYPIGDFQRHYSTGKGECPDNRDDAFALVEEFLEIEKSLKRKLQKFRSPEDFCSEEIFTICRRLMKRSKDILGLNPVLYNKHGLDQRVWKSALHDIIFLFGPRASRPELRASKVPEAVLLTIIQLGISHFKEEIESAQKIFDLDLQPILKKTGFLSCDDRAKEESVELFYRWLVYIGDLNRYAFHIKPSREFRKQASEYYEFARLCDIRKGRAFYQLGLIASIMGDTFGTAYNLTRACITAVPIEGSKLQLLDTYDHVYKQHKGESEKYWYKVSKEVEEVVRWSKTYSRETWLYSRKRKISTLVVPQLKDDPPTKEQHVSSLAPMELYKRFAITYTLFLGKIFTRIGMDTLEEVAEETLVYFEGLLKTNFKLPFTRVAQIAGMIIYSIDSININGLYDPSQKSQMKHVRTIAVQFLLEMFSIVAERVLKLTLISDWNNPQMESLSAALMLWCNWMANNDDWTFPRRRPRFSIRRIEKSRYENKKDKKDDIWVVFAQLMTRLEVVLFRLNSQIFPVVKRVKTDSCLTPLKPFPEVLVLSEFGTCLEGPLYSVTYYYRGRHSEQTLAQIFIRLINIRAFGSDYATRDYGLLWRKKGLYNAYSYSSETRVMTPPGDADSCGLDERHYQYWAGRKNEKKAEKLLRPDSNNARIILRKKHEIKVSPPAVPPPCPKSVIHETWFLLGNRGYYTDIIVNPMRIILDTNCFIRRFEYVKRVLGFIRYPLLIPVSVALELKGLAKGGMRPKYKERYSSQMDSPEAQEKLKEGNVTAEQCKIALEFIHSNMKYFQIVTITGRVLSVPSIYNRIQDDYYNPEQRNDDRILDTCRFIEGHDKALRKRDTDRRIWRHTVLLTGDRCLRIRTYVLDIPAIDITTFTEWIAGFFGHSLPKTPRHGRFRYNGKRRPRFR